MELIEAYLQATSNDNIRLINLQSKIEELVTKEVLTIDELEFIIEQKVNAKKALKSFSSRSITDYINDAIAGSLRDRLENDLNNPFAIDHQRLAFEREYYADFRTSSLPSMASLED
ncbi:hypothetical protein [Virgibacillus salexigens]|uniref:Uncharacterized protein n=1 Tax=Virgibacillus massiliensis TaxID=1462526 RepID=A0A024QIH5_9BACI|nr:hypothetical protein [Virgibacillus massiliensis]CDQ41766.1 hypothetical protein BN990_04143 [Virgibacillus massiliensis]